RRNRGRRRGLGRSRPVAACESGKNAKLRRRGFPMEKRRGWFKVPTMPGADFQIEKTRGGVALALSGDWTSMGLGRVYRRLAKALDGQAVTRLDISGLGRFDTSGALVLV